MQDLIKYLFNLPHYLLERKDGRKVGKPLQDFNKKHEVPTNATKGETLEMKVTLNRAPKQLHSIIHSRITDTLEAFVWATPG